MADTFTQLYVHIIFSTRNREKSLSKSFREEVFKYTAGIINKKGHKSLAVNGAIDHIHIFLGFKPAIKISDFVKDIKLTTGDFIKERKFVNNFYWQEGYGAFTYSHSQLNDVINYIKNQEKHHKRKTFKEENLEFLEKFEIQYDPKYVFE